uniref:Flavonoid 3'-hydroxylase n=1 Tax=Pohlia nutans TaxID=140635 RepID=W5XK02_9BRYO|nr:flavonoid 3'-hydroxylase [Pohlia nutans]
MGSEDAWMTSQLHSLQHPWSWNAAGLGRALYILAGVVFFAVVYFEQSSKRRERLAKLPPGPFQWPYLGSLPHLFLSAGLRSSSKLRETVAALETKHGPIMLLQIADLHVLVVSSGEFAKQVLVTHDAEFFFRPRCGVGKYLGFGSADIAFAEGRHHWYLRKLCDTRLFSSESFASNAPIRKHEAANMLRSLFEASQRGEAICVRDAVTTFVRNSLCGMLLGTGHLDVENTSLHFTKETLTTLLDEVVAVAGDTTLRELTPGLNSWGGRDEQMKDLHLRLTKYFQVILDDRSLRLETNAEPEALVDVLLSLDEDQKLSSDAIMGILLDSLVGGIYPITATVEWALTELVRHPALLERVQMEMTEVVGPYHIVHEAEFSQLSFFQAIVKETLRLHPAMAMSLPHMNKVATPVGDYEVPANTCVVMDYAAIGRDAKVWPKPLQFDPRRFVDTDAASQIDTFKLLPFGYGRRGCPGANLGVILVQLSLAYLVQGFDWRPLKGQLPHDIHVQEAAGVFCFRSTPLTLRATPRLSSTLYEI